MANATVTVKSSGGDYTSLNAALAGMAGNLTTNCGGTGGAGILTIECYAMQDTTSANTGTGYTTSADYYINITVPTAERHDGKWNTSKYRMVVDGHCLINQEAYTRITGLQLHQNTSTTYRHGIYQVGASTLVDTCIVKGSSVANNRGITDDGTGTTTIRNTIVYDWVTGIEAYANMTVQNVTLHNCTTGVLRGGGTCVCTNVGAAACTTAFSGTITQNTCSSSTPTFADADNDNFHLASNDSTWHDAGTDLSGTFTTDIDGETRVTWDIGADEYVAAAGGAIKIDRGAMFGIARGMYKRMVPGSGQYP